MAFPDVDQYLFDRLPESGVWQDDALSAGMRHCKGRRVALDCGAHIGTWSIALSDTFRNVYAFEPAGDTFEALTINTKTYTNVNVFRLAVGAAAGRASMEWTKKDRARHHTGARYIKKGNDMDVLTVDSLSFDDVDFIKLDLEGGEPDAIMGAQDTLLKCKPVIVFEDKGFCSRFGFSESASRDLLTEMGAVEFEKIGINRVWGWRENT